MKSTHGGVLILVPATLLKLTLLHECFSRFLNCANSTKSRNAPQITYCKRFYGKSYGPNSGTLVVKEKGFKGFKGFGNGKSLVKKHLKA